MEVVDFGPLSRATKFRISFPPFTGMNRCLVRPLANGRYRIERVDSLDLPEFLAGLISTAQRAKFDRLAQDFLVALTAAAESED
jgi:hypothetical protein